MKRTVLLLSCAATLLLGTGRADAEWWVGEIPYSLQANKYDSHYGEARQIRWSCQGPMTLWGPLTPSVTFPTAAAVPPVRNCPQCGKAAKPAVTPSFRQFFYPPSVAR